MPADTKIKGAISFASNTPGVPTGYGQQAEQLIERMLKSGLTVASMSNYGNEGGIEDLKLRTGKIKHYPRSYAGYSDDVLPSFHKHFTDAHPDLKSAILTLYDVWVYRNPRLNEIPIISWTPIDHLGIPPAVEEHLRKENVTPIAMAPHGKELMDLAGIESIYIPHGINTKVYKHTEKIRGVPTREYLGIKDSDFLVGMVAANKANATIHRKAFVENLMAFGIFVKDNPDAILYIHTDPTRALGGFDLVRLFKIAGIPPENIILPDPLDTRFGLQQQDMAALYSAFDVLLAPSYGEGFGVPTVEAQSCGTRVIVSSWTASKDLVADGGLQVAGVPFWDEPQGQFWKIPVVASIVDALKKAHELDRGFNESARKFALEFDSDKIYAEKWEPFLRDYFK